MEEGTLAEEGALVLCAPSLMDTHQTSTQRYKPRSLHNRLKGLGKVQVVPSAPSDGKQDGGELCTCDLWKTLAQSGSCLAGAVVGWAGFGD